MKKIILTACLLFISCSVFASETSQITLDTQGQFTCSAGALCNGYLMRVGASTSAKKLLKAQTAQACVNAGGVPGGIVDYNFAGSKVYDGYFTAGDSRVFYAGPAVKFIDFQAEIKRNCNF